ncbi:MAG: sugar transferase [Phycisphaerae bacterium]
MSVSHSWRMARLLLIAGDVLTVIATYVVADLLRTWCWLHKPWPEVLPGFGSAFEVHYWTLAVLPVAWPVVLRSLGWYERQWRRPQWYVSRALLGAAVLGLMLAGLALFFRRDVFPRRQVVLFTGLLPATALVARGISALAARRLASRRDRHVLIVGAGRDAVRLRRLLRSNGLGRSAVVGHLSVPGERPRGPLATGAVLGDISDLAGLLDRAVVDEVYFAVPIDRLAQVLPAVRGCEEVGVPAHVLAESPLCHTAPVMEDVHGIPMLAYARTRHAPELLAIKRIVDLLLATVGIVVSGPIMLVCAGLIRSSSPGPILFRQERVGLNGRLFRMLKFRTMMADADRRLGEVAHLNESSGPVFKSRVDPRVTALGAWLRKYSIDELPQLFNVLRGDMSMVGPRPPIPQEVAQYDRWQRRRLSMRPGLTCLWQIRGRHRVPFDEWMRLDLEYIDHWSLGLDLRIMCRTIVTVLSGTGA